MPKPCCICCQEPFEAGCYDRCATLVLSEAVPSPGIYTLKADFAGKTICVKVDLADGDPLAFPLQGLNEAYTFQAAIFNTAGERATFGDDEDTPFDCIRFSTQPGCSSNAAHNLTIIFQP